MSRRRMAAIVVLVVIVSAVGGWVLGSRVRSPAEIAAQTAVPDASPILVPAEQRTLSTDVVTRGTARFGSPQTLTTAPSALKPAPGIVTTTPGPGAEITEGGLVLTAAGRPVFLLSGDRLGVRDLGPGLQGEDVRQLEEALVRLGFDPVAVDGVYDGGTESAVSGWYEAAGFAPFETTEEQSAAIRARESELAAARVDLANASDGVATVEAELAAARAAYANAVSAQSASPASLAAAQAEADAANQAAQAEVTAKSVALDELLADPEASPGAVAIARSELAVAQANAASTRLAGGKLVADAATAGADATTAVDSAAAAVGAGERRLVIAQSLTGHQGAFVDLAAQEAGLAARRAGVQVPADEVVFAPRVPVRVSELHVAPGDKLEGSVMKATDAVVAVDGALALADASLVGPGMAVRIDEPDLGIDAAGTISQVAASPGTNGADGFHVWFEVVVDGAPPALVGTSVRLTVGIESTGDSVLAVPLSAVSLAPDGTSRVERDDGGGTTSFVEVEPGLSADGYVEVTPVGGKLEPGDLVVVGEGEGGGGSGSGG